MNIDPEVSEVSAVYRALIGIVTPRPIAWVTSLDREGRVNLAPFSFFNVFGANPPIVAFSPGLRPDGTKKDTLANIEATGEFVINAAVEALAEAMNQTSASLPPGESEAELAGIALAPSDRVKPPRVAQSPAYLECRLHQVLPISQASGTVYLVIGRIVMIHVDDAILDATGHVDAKKLKTVGRLGGLNYCRTSDVFSLLRPE